MGEAAVPGESRPGSIERAATAPNACRRTVEAVGEQR
jgi:hypothetical protein